MIALLGMQIPISLHMHACIRNGKQHFVRPVIVITGHLEADMHVMLQHVKADGIVAMAQTAISHVHVPAALRAGGTDLGVWRLACSYSKTMLSDAAV